MKFNSGLGLISMLLVLVGNSVAGEIKPFTSDGCSAFPDGTLQQQELWLSCCTAHDLAYWMGGSYSQREAADVALQQCVEQVGEPEVAIIMLAGVRVGGSPFFPTTFRWGYGWPYPKFYGELTASELAQIKRLMNAAGQSRDLQ